MSDTLTPHVSCSICHVHDVVARCNWKVPGWKTVEAKALIVGDICQNRGANRTGRVLAIEDVFTETGMKYLTLRCFVIQRLHKGKPNPIARVDNYEWSLGHHIRKQTEVDCAALVCEACVRDLGAGHHVCATHWPSQLAAIA